MKNVPTTQKGTIPIRWSEKRQRFILTVYISKKPTISSFRKESDALKAWTVHNQVIKRHGKQANEYTPEAHQEYAEAKRLVNGADLREIAHFWLAQQTDIERVSLADAAKEFLEAKKKRGLSVRHMRTLESHLRAFLAVFGSLPTQHINTEKVIQYLTDIPLDPRTIENHRISIQNLLNWCVRKKYLAKKVDLHREDLPVIKAKPKGTLTVAQTECMFQWLNRHRPYFVAWHALQAFAGLRSEEASRISWENIDLERRVIVLPANITKTQDEWALFGLPDNLWTWLNKYQDSGLIRSPSPNALKRIRKNEIPCLPTPIPVWPHNAMRHTFCSMMISLHEDAAKVANWSRHTNTRQLYQSYVTRLVSKEEAERYFSIVPEQ